MSEARSQVSNGGSNPVAVDLEREFPILWKITQQYDFAERLGGCSEPLWAEVDAAMRELWMARNAQLKKRWVQSGL